MNIPVDRILPPVIAMQGGRKRISKKLISNISKHGILLPLTVIPAGPDFRVIDGWKRLRVAKLLRLPDVECRVLDKSIASAALIHDSRPLKAIAFRRGLWRALETMTLQELGESVNMKLPKLRRFLCQ